MGYWSHQLYQYSLQAVWTAVYMLAAVHAEYFLFAFIKTNLVLSASQKNLASYELTKFGVIDSSITSVTTLMHTSLHLQLEGPWLAQTSALATWWPQENYSTKFCCLRLSQLSRACCYWHSLYHTILQVVRNSCVQTRSSIYIYIHIYLSLSRHGRITFLNMHGLCCIMNVHWSSFLRAEYDVSCWSFQVVLIVSFVFGNSSRFMLVICRGPSDLHEGHAYANRSNCNFNRCDRHICVYL